jgi:hypothetical protein
MSNNGDIWAVTPSTSATYYRAAASIGGAGALTLLTNDAGPNGVGYKVRFTSAGDDRGITFTIVGITVGNTLTGDLTTEVVTGANASTADSTNFFAVITSITASGASAGNVSIGTTGSIALPRTRLKGFYYLASGSAGSIKVNLNSSSGTELLNIATPASATGTQDMFLPGTGILTTSTGSSITDFSVVTITNVTNTVLFCG